MTSVKYVQLEILNTEEYCQELFIRKNFIFMKFARA